MDQAKILEFGEYWEVAMPYSQYRDILKRQAENGETSGSVQSEALIEYTRLNERRTARWEKKLELPPAALSQLNDLGSHQHWLVLNESWCGDAAHSVPVMNRFAELSDHIELKVLWRDEHLELMDQYLSGGTRGIPKLLIFDQDFALLAEWGSRPAPLQLQVDEVKSKHGKVPAEFKEVIQKWYNKDKGQTTAMELSELLFTYAEINK